MMLKYAQVSQQTTDSIRIVTICIPAACKTTVYAVPMTVQWTLEVNNKIR